MKNRLRVLRAERDLSQAALAEALGVSRQTVNAIETRRYDPGLPLAFKIARLFGLRIEEIFEPGDDEGPSAETSVSGLGRRGFTAAPARSDPKAARYSGRCGTK
jgi:putative transcriptional regulator